VSGLPPDPLPLRTLEDEAKVGSLVLAALGDAVLRGGLPALHEATSRLDRRDLGAALVWSLFDLGRLAGERLTRPERVTAEPVADEDVSEGESVFREVAAELLDGLDAALDVVRGLDEESLRLAVRSRVEDQWRAAIEKRKWRKRRFGEEP
jgi:hypothetical protein